MYLYMYTYVYARFGVNLESTRQENLASHHRPLLDSGFSVQRLGFGVWGSGFGVWGLGSVV